MKRYNCYEKDDYGCLHDASFAEEDGEWIKYEDHKLREFESKNPNDEFRLSKYVYKDW